MDDAPGSCSEAEFAKRMGAIPAAERDYALGIYANAIASKQLLKEGGHSVAG